MQTSKSALCCILQWNCRGFSTQGQEIGYLLHKFKPVCLCLQETNLTKNQLTRFKKYVVLSSEGPNGCALLIRDGVQYTEHTIPSPFETVSARIYFNKKWYCICSIYITPSKSFARDVFEKFFTDFSLLSRSGDSLLILGDFNARHPFWGDSTYNHRGVILEDVLTPSDYCLLNTDSPTHLHIQNKTFSNIDLSICSSELLLDMKWDVLEDPHGSDHFPIKISFLDMHPTPLAPRWAIKRADWNFFLQCLPFDLDVDDFEDVEHASQYFINHILMAAHASIPMTQPTTKCPLPWWNKDCTNASKARKAAFRRFRRTGDPTDRIIYKRRIAKARYIYKQANRDSWRQYVSSINRFTDSNKIWQRVRKIAKKRPYVPTPVLELGNQLIAEPQKVATAIAKNLQSLTDGSRYSERFLQIKHDAENQALDFHSNGSEIYNRPFTFSELRATLSGCSNTAPGPDSISFLFLQHLPQKGFHFLLDLYNWIWSTSVLPEGWKEAMVLPFLKPGKDPSKPENYRPISLTSCICKLMEKMINGRLVWYLERNNILSETQYGFRKMRTTTDLLIVLERSIREAFNAKQHLIAIFFDIEKAYDTTWKYGIMRELHGAGLRGLLPLFIKNFLSERIFKVKVADTCSTWFDQPEGVPQGSVLSVTCFALAYNGVTKCIPSDVSHLVFVDDLTIYLASTRIPFLCRLLQGAVTNIEHWASERGFRFSPSKTKVVQFTRHQGEPAEPELTMYGQPLAYVQQVKYLGLIFDNRLLWRPHLLYLRDRCMRDLNLLKVLSHHSWGSDTVTLLRLYNALIKPKLQYGSQAYGSACKSALKLLDPVHHAALRIATGAFRTSPIESLYSISGEMSLTNIRAVDDVRHFLRMKRLPHSFAYRQLTETPHVTLRVSSGLHRSFGLRLPELPGYDCLSGQRVFPYKIPAFPSWILPTPNICFSSFDAPKSSTNSVIIKQAVLQHIHSDHVNTEHIYTDGSKSDKGVGCAVVFPTSYIETALPSVTSIFTAELQALWLALNYIFYSTGTFFTIFSDSKSALQAIQVYHSDHPLISLIQQWLYKIHSKHKFVTFCWIPSHVGIVGNDEADLLARECAGDSDRLSPYAKIPHTDFSSTIKSAVVGKWQSVWDDCVGNKLHFIKPDVSKWDSSCDAVRKYEVLLTRLRIGHTRFTHGPLLRGEPYPECDDCDVPWTLYHIFIECPFLEQYRACLHRKYGNNLTMRSILGKPPAGAPFNIYPILSFLRSINLLHQL